MKQHLIKFGAFFLITTFIFSSCKKEKVLPPVPNPPSWFPAVVSNQPPVAYADPDITVAARCGKATIAGFWTSSDPSASVLWRQLSGPTQSTILHPNRAASLVSNLSEGTYSYMLEVSDKYGVSKDT